MKAVKVAETPLMYAPRMVWRMVRPSEILPMKKGVATAQEIQ